jgi:hypothetical protein
MQSSVHGRPLIIFYRKQECWTVMEKKGMRKDEERIAAPVMSTFNDDKWEAMYRRLRAYKQQFGHTQIPYRYEADPQLGRWGE